MKYFHSIGSSLFVFLGPTLYNQFEIFQQIKINFRLQVPHQGSISFHYEVGVI